MMMKIIVLHGEHVEESYVRLQVFIKEAKKRNWEIIHVSDRSKNIREELSKRSLFEEKSFYVIEDISLVSNKDFKWIKDKSEEIDATIIFYKKGLVSKTIINKFPKTIKVEEFKLPKIIWNFLDSFFPGNVKGCLLLLQKVSKNEQIEFIFALLARHVRDLYWVKADVKSSSLPSWRIPRLKRQASKFTQGKLIEIINKLSSIDIESKRTNKKLISLLDFVIATKLE
jgi:DNA polymerase III delta subunit